MRSDAERVLFVTFPLAGLINRSNGYGVDCNVVPSNEGSDHKGPMDDINGKYPVSFPAFRWGP